ncbi:hypothetical protein Bco22_002680 [Bartonella sp. Coyote22sub2]|nr:hypothetical protein Bho11B_004940 [Bartonella sp. 11B]AQX24202.1 hypothetical protein Bho114_008830 [Bartonella sp. 114]AQX24965.1 hypothetical protein Bco22_002680 [Bartonella sp. Coyote22sub2]
MDALLMTQQAEAVMMKHDQVLLLMVIILRLLF